LRHPDDAIAWRLVVGIFRLPAALVAALHTMDGASLLCTSPSYRGDMMGGDKLAKETKLLSIFLLRYGHFRACTPLAPLRWVTVSLLRRFRLQRPGRWFFTGWRQLRPGIFDLWLEGLALEVL
jgi:hypothetical protein